MAEHVTIKIKGDSSNEYLGRFRLTDRVLRLCWTCHEFKVSAIDVKTGGRRYKSGYIGSDTETYTQIFGTIAFKISSMNCLFLIYFLYINIFVKPAFCLQDLSNVKILL